MPAPLTTRARAKINLTLRVLGRRADGYHELESLVAFAGTGDALSLEPGPQLSLTIDGPRGQGLPVDDSNLILRATRALEAETGPLRTGAFHLVKRLPVASGIGGGSADAAAALRLLARLNGLSPDDPALLRAAAATGADVPVCLASRARIMAGIGERLGSALTLPPLFALLVNPGVPVETAPVFRALGLQPGQRHPLHSSLPDTSPHPEEPRSGVSKEGPEGSGTVWSLLRDALSDDMAPRMRARGGAGWIAPRCSPPSGRPATTSKPPPAASRPSSTRCSPPCAPSPAAASPACPARARPASPSSTTAARARRRDGRWRGSRLAGG